MSDWQKDLGKLLHMARRDSGFTQRELAERVGTSYATISTLERGERPGVTFELVYRLSCELGLSLDALLPKKQNGHREPAAAPRRRQGAAAAASSKLRNHAAKAEQSHSKSSAVAG